MFGQPAATNAGLHFQTDTAKNFWSLAGIAAPSKNKSHEGRTVFHRKTHCRISTMSDEYTPSISYRVDTKITKDDLIVQELYDANQMLSRWILDARDKQITAALVSLGWTPPQKLIAESQP
jgi:hypothetical protein